ncbi:MAG: hypothetical protein KKF44_00990 [Nanoarchaeota archaeon]|nr:hypothetical protein [Nanoarchaeota archaeon]
MQATKKLPDVEKLRIGSKTTKGQSSTSNPELNKKLENAEIALSFLMKNIEDIKKEAHSQIVDDYEEKISNLKGIIDEQTSIIKEYDIKFQRIDSTLLKGHKATLERLNRMLIEKDNEIMTYKRKYTESESFSKRLVEHSKRFEKENNELKILVNEMGVRIEQEQETFKNKLNQIWSRHDKELHMISQEHMEKEIELKSRIESLKNDLSMYHEVLRVNKVKREKMFSAIKMLIDNFENKSLNTRTEILEKIESEKQD